MELQRTRNPAIHWRSEASSNWRVKDDGPRTEAPRSEVPAPPRQRFVDQRKDNSNFAAITEPAPGTRFSMGNFSTPRSNVGKITKAAPMTFGPTSVFMKGKEGGSSPTTLREAAPGTRLYVGNLIYKAQVDDIQHLFKVNGFADAQIDMSTDPFTGRNPSYCFVDLRTAEDASIAMAELNGMEVLGRPVKIKPGVAKKSSMPVEGLGGHAEPPRRNAYQATEYKPTFDRWTRADAAAHWEGAPKPGHRVHVGGLPRIDSQPTVDIEMQALFGGFQITAVSKIISPHPSKASQPGNHFYLFVDLSSTEEADRAIEALNGMPAPWGGNVTVTGTHGGGKKVIREQLEGKKGVWDEDGKSVDGMGSL